MKAEGLLKYTTVSDVRKGLLFEMIDGPMTLAEIREHFHVTSANVLPRLKDLVNMNLVLKGDGIYALTPAGLLLAKKLRRADRLAEIIEKYGQFLNEHDLSPLGPALTDRIDELGSCQVISNTFDNLSETHDRIYGNIMKSAFILGICPAYNTTYPGIYQNIAKAGIPVSLILTEPILKKLAADPIGLLEPYLSHANAKLYIKEDIRLTLVITDQLLSLYLPDKNGIMDFNNCLMSSDESAIAWGKELFDKYRSKSKNITSR